MTALAVGLVGIGVAATVLALARRAVLGTPCAAGATALAIAYAVAGDDVFAVGSGALILLATGVSVVGEVVWRLVSEDEMFSSS